MNKGIFFIPIDKKNKKPDVLFDEIINQTVISEKWGLNEAYFGEHITDMHEKITSSIMMISALSKLTKKIKLGTLTTNLNFYKPAVIAAAISQVDNLSHGRLMLGVGSGTNLSDLESIGMMKENNHKLMLESLEIIKEILFKKNKSFFQKKTDNYFVSTKKTYNRKLGLGSFNKLFNSRKNLDIVMPVLNKNSYNVRLCAKNNWSNVISNFCSDEIIENHIESYIKNSRLKKKDALKKIKLSKLIFVQEKNDKIEDRLLSKNSPYLQVVDTLFTKLKTFKRHGCFGENVNNSSVATKQIVMHGTIKNVRDKINYYNDKYGELGSIIYVNVPNSKDKFYNKSFELFSKHV